MKFCVLLACLLVVVYGRTVHKSEEREWNAFKAEHDKTYKNASEERYRMTVFLKNKAFVEAHNKLYASGGTSFTVALNKFADLTNEEFVSKFNSYITSDMQKSTNVFQTRSLMTPTSIDWRDFGAVTEVRDQGPCASSWTFSATGSVEGQHKLATGNLVSLSEQQLIDCDLASYGCLGGYMDDAFQYIIDNHGIDTDASYPYTAEDDACKSSTKSIGATISDYVDIPSGDEKALTTAIGNVGPISVAIDAGQISFQFYHDGIYDEPQCSSSVLDRGLLAVGYNSLNGTDYYIVRNNWSTEWGMEGYVYMSRNKDNQCGIATVASYPVV